MTTMRTMMIIAIISFSGRLCFGQGKDVFIPVYGNGDTSLWFKWQQEKFSEAGLSDLTIARDNLYFRFSTEIQAVEIRTTDFKTFYGTFTDFTSGTGDSYKKENPKSGKFYSNKSSLDTATTRQVYNLFTGLSIFSIPTGDSIRGWYPGYDGIEYLIEYSTPATYSFKEYWTPSNYKDKIKEAAMIDSLANQLEMILQMRESFETFIGTLPDGSYQAGGMAVTVKSKARKTKRERKPGNG